MDGLLFVHDYGNWHIVSKDNMERAFCGASYQPQKGHWAAQMHFHEPAGLEIDERWVCAVCLYDLHDEPYQPPVSTNTTP